MKCSHCNNPVRYLGKSSEDGRIYEHRSKPTNCFYVLKEVYVDFGNTINQDVQTNAETNKNT